MQGAVSLLMVPHGSAVKTPHAEPPQALAKLSWTDHSIVTCRDCNWVHFVTVRSGRPSCSHTALSHWLPCLQGTMSVWGADLRCARPQQPDCGTCADGCQSIISHPLCNLTHSACGPGCLTLDCSLQTAKLPTTTQLCMAASGAYYRCAERRKLHC